MCVYLSVCVACFELVATYQFPPTHYHFVLTEKLSLNLFCILINFHLSETHTPDGCMLLWVTV